MTLPTSGPLSLADIQTEFGGSNPISLNEYYAGGAYVPSGTTGTNGAVPSSGTISISNFYGTSNVVVNFSDAYPDSIVTTPDTATTQYQVNSNGSAYINFGVYEQWITPTSQASNYEVYATLSAGSLTSGTTGSWLAVTGNPSWTVVRSAVGTSTATLAMQVRKVGTTTVLDTWNVYFTATVDI